MLYLFYTSTGHEYLWLLKVSSLLQNQLGLCLIQFIHKEHLSIPVFVFHEYYRMPRRVRYEMAENGPWYSVCVESDTRSDEKVKGNTLSPSATERLILCTVLPIT